MNTLRTHLVTGALLAALAGAAFAQAAPTAPAPAAAGERQHRFDPAQRQERAARRLADLKQKLQLSPGQELGWTSFAEAMRPGADRKRMDREAVARMATPERIDHLRAMRQQRLAEMDRRGEATKSFYATLTPDQKKVFDAESLRMVHGGRKHGGHGG